METTGAPDPAAARAALSAIDRATNAVRDHPWPTWLYIANTLLTVLLGLTFAANRPPGAILTLTTSAAMMAVNWIAARRMGVTYALPRSRAFLTAVAIAACFLAAAGVWGISASAPTAAIAALALAAGLSYALGSIAHYRSTRP